MAIRYSVESWAAYWPDASPLWEAHWREVAMDQEAIPLDVDMDAYAALDSEGRLHILTARDEERLVGYHLAILRGHLHYKSTLHAFTDLYYLLPAYRRGVTGYRLLQHAEASVREHGAKKLLTGTKMHLDMSGLFARMGYRETERLWTKLL